MKKVILDHILMMIEAHKLKIRCDLRQKVLKIEEILLKVLSLHFSDYYNPETFVQRVELAIRAACVQAHTNRKLAEIALEYDITPEKYETIFHLYKTRELIVILWENRIRLNDIQNAKISEIQYIEMTKNLHGELDGIKKIQ